MQGPIERHDPSRMRVSDEERHQVAEVLRLAAGEGRIDVEELEERLEAAYAAKTYADLAPLTADLPRPGASPGQHPVAPVVPPAATHAAAFDPPPSYASSVSVMADTRRLGPWLVPVQHTAFAMMGSVTLDLREAQFSTREVTITAVAFMGDVTIVVNPYTRVVVDGVAVMADFREARPKVPAELAPDAPVVRVKGLAVMASVSVQRKAMPGDQPKRISWRR